MTSETQERKPISPPKPTISSDGSSEYVSDLALRPRIANGKPHLSSGKPQRRSWAAAKPRRVSRAMSEAGGVASSFTMAAARTATSSILTRASASAPLAYISRSISAVARPLGKGSLSTMSICRRNGMATVMPTRHTEKIHMASGHQVSV